MILGNGDRFRALPEFMDFNNFGGLDHLRGKCKVWVPVYSGLVRFWEIRFGGSTGNRRFYSMFPFPHFGRGHDFDSV